MKKIIFFLTFALTPFLVFSDDENKMNLSVREVNGDILLVSQFTLAANTQKGLRPSFSSAAKSETSKPLFEMMVKTFADQYRPIQTGKFGADMQVSLCNDGPVTFLLSI